MSREERNRERDRKYFKKRRKKEAILSVRNCDDDKGGHGYVDPTPYNAVRLLRKELDKMIVQRAILQ